MRIAIAVIAMVVLTLGGALGIMLWFADMTTIRVSQADELPTAPPTPAELVEQGAALVVQGEVTNVHLPEWNTPDGERPSTPWDISRVPDDYWIQTPVSISPDEPPLILEQDVVESLGGTNQSNDIRFVYKGGEIGDDVVKIDDGKDRDFSTGETALVVLGPVNAGDDDSPQLADTFHGDAWQLMRKYTLTDDGTAVLQWDGEEYEQPVDEVIRAFEDAR